METNHFGQISEDLAAQWLEANGYKVVEKNYRKRYGEIDLIALKQDVISFVEVKARKNNYFYLSEVITPSKRRKIIITAKEYLVKNKIQNKIIRFDVALIQNNNVNYIENAFNEENLY